MHKARKVDRAWEETEKGGDLRKRASDIDTTLFEYSMSNTSSIYQGCTVVHTQNYM
jgi:hypothetical protein